MTALTADFEKGSNGSTIATTDPGSATAWTSVTIGVGNTLTYDNTHAAHGSLAAKIGSAAGNQLDYLAWDFGPVTTDYGRCYMYFTGVPAAFMTIVSAFNTATEVFTAFLSSTGKLHLSADGALGDSTTSVALNQWTRIEWKVVNSATVGTLDVYLFNTADSVTADEHLSFTNLNTSAQTNRYQFGNSDTTDDSALTYWIDDLVAGAASYPGPWVAPIIVNISGLRWHPGW